MSRPAGPERHLEDHVQGKGVAGYAVLLRTHPERVPMTERTFARLDKGSRRLYWHRRFDLMPTELAARCLANEHKVRTIHLTQPPREGGIGE